MEQANLTAENYIGMESTPLDQGTGDSKREDTHDESGTETAMTVHDNHIQDAVTKETADSGMDVDNTQADAADIRATNKGRERSNPPPAHMPSAIRDDNTTGKKREKRKLQWQHK
jgi:hypothetical protein